MCICFSAPPEHTIRCSIIFPKGEPWLQATHLHHPHQRLQWRSDLGVMDNSFDRQGDDQQCSGQRRSAAKPLNPGSGAPSSPLFIFLQTRWRPSSITARLGFFFSSSGEQLTRSGNSSSKQGRRPIPVDSIHRPAPPSDPKSSIKGPPGSRPKSAEATQLSANETRTDNNEIRNLGSMTSQSTTNRASNGSKMDGHGSLWRDLAIWPIWAATVDPHPHQRSKIGSMHSPNLKRRADSRRTWAGNYASPSRTAQQRLHFEHSAGNERFSNRQAVNNAQAYAV
ncbi:hypothetical protein ACLOJK_011395 [Asimina triloba]